MNGQTNTSEMPLFIPVILGTARQGRHSEAVARFVTSEMARFPGVETQLVDMRDLPIPLTGAGQDVKDPGFSELCMRADAFVIVAPEYNHGYPGLLKHVLDTNLKEYIHKAVGICGVSAGGFGGTRVIENLLPSCGSWASSRSSGTEASMCASCSGPTASFSGRRIGGGSTSSRGN